MNAILSLTSENPDIDYDDDGGHFTLDHRDTNNEQAINSSSNACVFTND